MGGDGGAQLGDKFQVQPVTRKDGLQPFRLRLVMRPVPMLDPAKFNGRLHAAHGDSGLLKFADRAVDEFPALGRMIVADENGKPAVVLGRE